MCGRGLTGEAINCYIKEARLDRREYQKLYEKYQQLDLSYQRMPPKLMEILASECRKLEKN